MGGQEGKATFGQCISIKWLTLYSGKSSLLNALLRFLPISSGSITIDGIEINTISPQLLRERLAVIPQDSFILPGTVRANADPLGLHSDTDIISALTKTGIWDTLKSRSGLDAILLDSPLSQGQQQLFGLARAMLRSSTVLIIDEATSSLDSETDRVVQQIIREQFKAHTVICVAHRVSDPLLGELSEPFFLNFFFIFM